MCILATLVGVLPDCPLLVLTNREEFSDRPASPPQLFHEQASQPAWFGPSDRKAGGTWLGINRFGLVVVLTNRPTPTGNEESRSRGLLCRDLLKCPSTDDAVDEVHRQRHCFAYAGFNVLLLSTKRSVVIEAGETIATIPLFPGIHCIANASLNDPDDLRLWRLRSEAETIPSEKQTIDGYVNTSKRICSLTAEKDDESICRTGSLWKGRVWGTVSSTIIAIPESSANIVFAYAAGPPSEVAYEDYSSKARLLFQKK